MKNIKIIVFLIILFISLSTLMNILEFKENYTAFENSFKNFFNHVLTSAYTGADNEPYFNAFKTSFIKLMGSYFNLRSVSSAVICVIAGVILLVEPIQENFTEFCKRIIDYVLPS